MSTLSAAEHSNSSVMDQVGPNIIHHVSNTFSETDAFHPIISLPTVFGVNLSVSKHVLMLWIVSFLLVLTIILPVRKFIRSKKRVPSGWVNAIEAIAKFIRDAIALPNIGEKWILTWAPLLMTFFFFILYSNGIGMVPIFDVLGLINRFVIGVPPDAHGTHSGNVINDMLHGGVTATGNFNVTGALATVTFFSIMIAGTLAHGFLQHWKNLVPNGLPIPVYFLLIPIEIMGLFVKPFALTMRLAANMTGGHVALLALLSLMAIFGELFGTSVGIGVASIAIPMAVAVAALEIIVVLVQAYVFTLLTAVFIGMAIHVHH
jgi:F-type H+-transporting ATPase subunit a